MSNRDLLKEAIADAKTIKETAIANAKAALEETFAPQLRSMLSAKLEEMEKEEMDEEIEEVVTNEAKDEIEEAKEDMEEGYGKEDMDEELDLDEILAELEEGEDKEDVKEAEEMDETIDEAEEDEEVEDDAEEMEGEDEDEEIDLEEMSEEDLKSFIEDVIADMVEAGELEAGEEFDAEEDMEDMDGEEEIEIEDETEEIMEGEKEEVDEAELNESAFMDLATALRDSGLVDAENAMMAAKALVAGGSLGTAAIGGMVAALRDKMAKKSTAEGEMEDMMEEVNALRAELHEVNLLNAKLLYTNKIFRAKNLKEAQKVKVLEAFDKASNVKEVKLVFETLSNEVKTTKTVVKENLGSASKAVGMIAENKAPIVDVNPQVARWQKLAGIK
jgi:hypothetical protein